MKECQILRVFSDVLFADLLLLLPCYCTGYKIPVIENLGATLVSMNFCLLFIFFGNSRLANNNEQICTFCRISYAFSTLALIVP